MAYGAIWSFPAAVLPTHTPEGRTPGEGASKSTPVRKSGNEDIFRKGRKPPPENF